MTVQGYRSPPSPAGAEPSPPALCSTLKPLCQTHRRTPLSPHTHLSIFPGDLIVPRVPPSPVRPFHPSFGRPPPSASETASDASSLGAVRRDNLSAAGRRRQRLTAVICQAPGDGRGSQPIAGGHRRDKHVKLNLITRAPTVAPVRNMFDYSRASMLEEHSNACLRDQCHSTV